MQFANGLRRLWRDVQFLLNKKQILTPPGEPLLDSATYACLERELSSTSVYVEYGSGGATLQAAQRASFVVSVESDADYLALVQERLASAPASGEVFVLHGDVGPTAEWGTPILRIGRKAVSGERYANAPWRLLESRRKRADLVVIDGRYRIACALTALLHPLGENALLLIDDFERHYYHPVLEYVDVIESPGRGILVRRRETIDKASCRAELQRRLRDWR